MAKTVKIASMCKYNGHNIRANKSVDLSLKFSYEELPNYIKVIQLLNENVSIVVKVGDNKPSKLGIFMVKEIKIDHDGEGLLKFNSMLDHVEANEINELVGADYIKIRFDAEIEDIQEEDEEDE